MAHLLQQIAQSHPSSNKKQLQQDLAFVSSEMYKRNRELAETNKTLSLLRTIDELVLESHMSLKMVCERVTQAITKVTDYPFVGLLTRSTRRPDHVLLQGWSSAFINDSQSLKFSRPLHVRLDNPWFDKPEVSRLISFSNLPPSEVAAILGISASELARVLDIMPLKAMYIIKLRARRRLVGLLVIGFYGDADQLDESDVGLMNQVSNSIGIAIDNKLLFEENQYVLRQLKDSNAKLLALDEAKDDFISMASHQLRTPLTSVKGYLSMVMEGDAGPINEVQLKMLGQALFSSQRMVYLIADLLNVSRLRTGKFIIDSRLINLADMVAEEIDQLSETARSRNLELIFEKPKNFPLLSLDETKTRQVIMNFIDNAIYYSPAAGQITVRLRELDRTIELRIEDNGIGVPEAEQRHLFTKFYRAGNARHARPDGTGLGLYMAKKVIIAEGGSLIFSSQEGKGSTFGFVFSKTNKNAAHIPVVPENN